ncbi:hypothetical protein [Gynuella sunshinyii]|uniref:Membrane-bound metal-dependent hydrolase (DUF457) n=1 Tax=Gynuella sunshinyii YC6258 TaxID=1445510 RepID=A0A0C5VRY0_9GAMM|nr:hypothetical protein [Gynuella sunshinyii]AJQ96113.1 hypothetical Protein YC6258_04077 [Gynuella sunshinyii YC6258]
MPFTPFHMGPGLLIKSLLHGAFSLMVFGWSQVVMDIQPLLVLLTGSGHLHGFSHTYIGAALLAVFSALSGKYLSELGLFLLGMDPHRNIRISWSVAFLSAAIGTISHVLLDSIMHEDIVPFFPLSADNGLLHIISVSALHEVCLYSGAVGAVIYYTVLGIRKYRELD